jgi:spore coat protein JB
VIEELGLYLDTHCDDSEAFALFQEYVALERDGRKRYEALFGPVTQAAAADSNCYTWLNDPWPWEMTKGGDK